MKKKLLIITGAGASIDLGMPSVPKINDLFKKWGSQIAPINKNQNLYSYLEEEYKKYARINPKNNLEDGSIINFEKMLFVIQNLATLLNDRNRGYNRHFLNPYTTIVGLPKTRCDLYELHSRLVDKLLDHFRQECLNLEKNKPNELKILGTFWEELSKKFDLGFINLNYDNVVLTSLPNLHTGFESTGKFDYPSILSNDWNFCYHLHGSVHFEMRGDGFADMHKIYWEFDLNKRFAQNSGGRNNEMLEDGIEHLNSCIITGLGKTTQILKQPFASYYSELHRKIYESDAILFIGYGFADYHLNKIVRNFRFDGKNRKIVVIDYANSDQDPLRVRHDSWSSGLFATIPVNAFEMSDGKHKAMQFMMHYLDKKILEKSSNHDAPLAIWYNGFIEACKHPNKIMKELL